jgi:hypothetical protein
MATTELTDEQIRLRGLEVLYRELGPAGLIRFLQQFESGEGDYSVERHKWLEAYSLEDLLNDLKRKQSQ